MRKTPVLSPPAYFHGFRGTEQEYRASYEREGGAAWASGRGLERAAGTVAQLGTQVRAWSESRPSLVALHGVCRCWPGGCWAQRVRLGGELSNTESVGERIRRS